MKGTDNMKDERVVWESNDKIYRIIEYLVMHIDLVDLKGDFYNPDVNTDINPEQLRNEEAAFDREVEQEGIYGYQLEKWNSEAGRGYEHIDSLHGFVGSYNPSNERYDHYIIEEFKDTVNQYTKEGK
jgi:hypothetical protein